MLGSGLCCDALLVGDHNHHLRKDIKNHKNTFISLLCAREARHVVHGDGFPWPIRSRKRGVQTMFLSGQFGNNVGSEKPDILDDLMSKLRPVEMFLQHFHCVFNNEVSYHPTVVGLLD
jgi:hypothetical protein